MDFVPFPKIPRLKREVCVTEKIDGTNAQVNIRVINDPLINVSAVMEKLRTLGSVAAPGFMKPEGIIVYHSAARSYFKMTLEKDSEPKGRVLEAA